MSDANDARPTNSIQDQLSIGLDLDDIDSGVDWSEDGEDYDQHTEFDRGPEFDIIWEETDTYPPTIDSDVVHALIDDTDHEYRIEFLDGRTREVKVTAIAMFAYLDEEAHVEVLE